MTHTEPPSSVSAEFPIADYGVIGDCHGAALVARDGRIDWACLRRFDADPVFCRLLNGCRGGSLETAPETAFETTRAYLPGTNILQTIFHTRDGAVRLTDFMPLGRQIRRGVRGYADSRPVRRGNGAYKQSQLDV